MARTPNDPTKAQAWVWGTPPDLEMELYIPRGARGEPGGIAVAGDLGNNNLDSYTVPGVYRQTNGAYSTLLNNYPVAGGIGVLTVLSAQSDNSRFEQTWDPIALSEPGSGRVFYRRVHYAGTWYPWKAFNSTRVDNTAGRAIYQWDNLSNREQLIYGDTGNRNITADLVQGTASAVFLRRVGWSVEMAWVSYVRPAVDPGGQYTVYTVPLGFKPQTGLAVHPLYQSNGNVSFMDVSGASGIVKPLVYPASGNWLGRWQWFTNDPWPTTLPGTASGSIPNL